MRKVMEPDWETKLLEASVRDSGEQEKRFLSLVDQAAGNIDLRIAKVLMRTYLAKPDFGTQERVESVMATADPKIVVQAVMEEMPRLVSEAPEWAETLLGQELEHRPNLVVAVMDTLPTQVTKAMKTVASNPEFASFYVNAGLLNTGNA
jgi:hypothetical protein